MDKCSTPPKHQNKSGSGQGVVQRNETKKGVSDWKSKGKVGPPKESGARTSGESAKDGRPARQTSKTGHGEKHFAKNIIAKTEEYKLTAVYLRGRDLMYPDEHALANFNRWVENNMTSIDASEQFACTKCGHVGFLLCAHRIDGLEEQQEAVVDEVIEQIIVPHNLRHHTWSFRPVEAIRKAFKWPSFDTHSHVDDRLIGFSNHHLNENLIVVPLHAYLLMNMQTSYRVNGTEDRALRLAHCHKLAQRWIILNEKEEQVEDLHYGVRIRFTIQRACDNAQNAMLYEERGPAQNFGLAWLPGSRVKQFMLVVMLFLALYHYSLVASLSLRVFQIASLFVQICLSILTYLGATVPDMTMRFYVSATAPPSGSEPTFECVHTEYLIRWYAPPDVQHVTLSCSFMDWVTAGMTEASLNTEEIFDQTWTHISKARDDECRSAFWEQAQIHLIWTSSRFMEYLAAGQLTSSDLLRLWWRGLVVAVKILIYHC